MFWGGLSDRIGRKPVLLLGCIGTAFSMVILGFAPNIWVALLGRAIGGLLNGNIGVIQTMVGELVTKPEHERKFTSGTASALKEAGLTHSQLALSQSCHLFGASARFSDPASAGPLQTLTRHGRTLSRLDPFSSDTLISYPILSALPSFLSALSWASSSLRKPILTCSPVSPFPPTLMSLRRLR